MPSIDFSVYCDKCGAGLCNETTVRHDSAEVSISIEPCETCLENADEEGFERGKEEGYDDGKQDGHKEGYEEGVAGTE